MRARTRGLLEQLTYLFTIFSNLDQNVEANKEHTDSKHIAVVRDHLEEQIESIIKELYHAKLQ